MLKVCCVLLHAKVLAYITCVYKLQSIIKSKPLTNGVSCSLREVSRMLHSSETSWKLYNFVFTYALFCCCICSDCFLYFHTEKHFTVSKARNTRLIKGSIFNMFRFENGVVTGVLKVIFTKLCSKQRNHNNNSLACVQLRFTNSKHAWSQSWF